MIFIKLIIIFSKLKKKFQFYSKLRNNIRISLITDEYPFSKIVSHILIMIKIMRLTLLKTEIKISTGLMMIII